MWRPRKYCRKCWRQVVHPKRKYLICLDCLIKLLRDEEVIFVPSWEIDREAERYG